jgi:hypothetical protein
MINKKDIILNKLVEVYTYHEEMSFILGYVVTLDKIGFLVHMVDKYALYNGYVYIKYEDTSLIIYDTIYIEKYLKLIPIKNVKKDLIEIDSFEIMNEIFNISIKKGVLIELIVYSDEEDDTIGVIDSYNNESIKIKRYNYYGKKDGVAIIPIENIKTVKIDTVELQNLEIIIKEQ